MTNSSEVDVARRKLLRKLGLGAGLAYIAPALVGIQAARASGTSGGSSGPSGPSGSGSSGPSGPSRGSSRPSAPRTAQQPQPRAQAQRRAPPPPELVALVPSGLPLEPARAAGFTALSQRDMGALSGTLVRFALPPGQSPAEALPTLLNVLPGTVADVNHVYTPDDFLCDGPECSAFATIGWAGWPSALRPKLGMIDTGINLDHPALEGRNLRVFQADLGARAAAGRQHGTAIAALLIGSVEGRVPGLLPDAALVAVEAFHRQGNAEQADAFAIGNAIDVLMTEQVDVINMSFSGPANAVVQRAITAAAAQGIGLVAAAGNGGPGAEPAYPAAWPEVIAVTAIDAQGRVYRQANQGPYIALAAPGVNLWTAASISGGRLRTGTSYAAPFVTATLAAERKRSPQVPVPDLTARLFACARDLGEAGFDPVYGHGLLIAPEQCAAPDALFSVSGE